MAYVILHEFDQENPPRVRTFKERAWFVGKAIQLGVRPMLSAAGLVTALVGGSILGYIIGTGGLPLPWALLIVAGVILVWMLAGAYALWDGADRAAWRYAPTWERLQTRVDTLQALKVAGPDDARFPQTWAAGHLAATRRDFDQATAAGFEPDFDRERLGQLPKADLDELIKALEAVVVAWREEEAKRF